MNTSLEAASLPLKIQEEQIQLLERLCNAIAVSGDEGEVRSIVVEQVKPYARDIKVDALGNVLVACPAPDENLPRVMLAAHMDEVGLMITNDEENGIFRFATVGSLDVRHLAGKAVQVGKSHTPGVIGAKPIHLTTPEERKNAFTLETLRVDVGPENKGKVKVGDRVGFTTQFTRMGPSLCAKALDNRLGVASLIELVKRPPANIQLLAAFTVQEEIGLRGARVAGYAMNPDLAIALDCTPANDLPLVEAGETGSENIRYNTRLDGGPALYIADHHTISDPRLVRHFIESAEGAGIPYQIRQPGGGGTDAGAIHLQRAGIPSISISVPGRYPHSAAGLARLDDWEKTLQLVYAAVSQLRQDIFSAER